MKNNFFGHVNTVNNFDNLKNLLPDEKEGKPFTIEGQSQISERIVFISHRTTDKSVADLIRDFLVKIGVTHQSIFCTSSPGNDVRYKIRPEIKTALKSSVVIILILSKGYYESPFCLNEAGIAWYLSDSLSVIPIALPGIDRNSLKGFIDDDFKLRRIDSEEDVSFIYDEIVEKIGLPILRHETVRNEISRLVCDYNKIV